MREPLLFGLRLWASVCLGLFVAFWLELDNPSWVATSAAIMCQPQLGASLRKGWFRIVGTVIGAIVIVVLTALFPQDRIAFLGLLALWCGICALGATVLRNFASYGAALSGYTAALIAADVLGATGGASPDVFLVAVWRASEICIGIVCAGIVLAGTDLGGAQRKLAASVAALAASVAGGFTRMLERAGTDAPDTQEERRELVRRVIALEPAIDETLGESSRIRYHSPTLQAAVNGFYRALNGWRGVAAHLGRSSEEVDRQAAQAILRSLPSTLLTTAETGSADRWMADPVALRRACAQAMQALLALPANTPSLRLLADEAAKVLAGMTQVVDGLALLVDAPGRPLASQWRYRLNVPDWLPAYVNAARALVAIGLAELFWVVTAWPNGGFMIVFVAVVTLLLSPRGDVAYAAAVASTMGVIVAVIVAAIIEFAVLPPLRTFPVFCLAMAVFFIPVGFGLIRSSNPGVKGALTIMAVVFMPVLAPTNQMNYDTSQFYNTALALVVGCGIAPLSFRLIPPLSPVYRARRLLAFTLRDVRRLALSLRPVPSEDWESHVYGRLAVLPDQAEPLQRAQLVAALAVGTEIIHLRRIAPRLGVAAELAAVLDAVAQGSSARALTRLQQLDRRIAASGDSGPDASVVPRARGHVLAMSEAIAKHAVYFDAGAVA